MTLIESLIVHLIREEKIGTAEASALYAAVHNYRPTSVLIEEYGTLHVDGMTNLLSEVQE